MPVVSVGNITAGGTGKTPVCQDLAERLHRAGVRAGIATRGYGRTGADPLTISPGGAPADWRVTGDEPLLYLARGHTAAVAVDPDRFRGGAALAARACRVVLLDDGFQFVTLKRDADIVCLDARNPFGYGRLLPRGTLREPLSALARATLFWLTHAPDPAAPHVAETLRRLAAAHPLTPVALSRHAPRDLLALGDGATLPADSIQGQRLCALSGIGSPESFELSVETLCGVPVLAVRHQDHHPFTDADLRAAETLARAERCDAVITTEKDAVRVPGSFTPGLPWLVLRIGIEVMQGEEHIQKIVDLGLVTK